MKTAIITDWLEKFGGAEKVIQSICEIFDFDYYYAYIDLMPEETKKIVFSREVHVTESPVLRLFKKRFRYLMPFFPWIVKDFNQRTKQNDVGLVISSSWCLSKAYRINNETHICYLQARNFKYIWDEADLYFKGIIKLLSFTKYFLRKFDIQSAQNPDILISNSKFVQDWVWNHYKRESALIYPPVDVDDFYISAQKGDYYITIGRLEPYKRFDIIVDAFNKSGKNLKIIGSGSTLGKLKRNAKSNIEFLGFLPKEEVKILLSGAKGFVYAGVEDFGIVVVESLASGVPVIGYQGGAMDEIVENDVDGVIYSEQSSKSLNDAIDEFEKKMDIFDPYKIKTRASRFSKKRFQDEFRSLVNKVIDGKDLF